MSLEENKILARRWLEQVWSEGNLAELDELCAADFVWHWAPPRVASNREGYKQFVTTGFAAFSDVRCPAEDIIAEGDKVVIRWTWLCTQTGEYMGIAPTGKQITMSGISILRIAGGKITEEWGEMDNMGLMAQLGVELG